MLRNSRMSLKSAFTCATCFGSIKQGVFRHVAQLAQLAQQLINFSGSAILKCVSALREKGDGRKLRVDGTVSRADKKKQSPDSMGMI